ncbi:hypothetical protein SDC9_111842 [bioreactor metagenome]|uniref:Uncharacterized protein n=1 Tax=bioreactor metagenome TaxID=1076179 RepID=A0A645BHK4_9ZZZZ
MLSSGEAAFIGDDKRKRNPNSGEGTVAGAKVRNECLLLRSGLHRSCGRKIDLIFDEIGRGKDY